MSRDIFNIKNIFYILLKLNIFQFFLREDGVAKYLTKGDNNQVDDRGLYAPGQIWLERKDIIGKAKGFIPYIGIVTILMNDYPQLKVKNKLRKLNLNRLLILFYFSF